MTEGTDPPAAGLTVTPPRPGASGSADLAALLQVAFSAETLERSLTHRSYAYEQGGLPTNERLEFLGDAVLGLVVTDTLYRRHPDLPEGQLAKLRAAVVNMRALAGVARRLDLGAHVRLGKGEESTGGRDKSSILADLVESLIGAAYIDAGLDEATGLVHRLIDPLIDQAAELGAGLDWKTSLQELVAQLGANPPSYQITSSGPDHAKTFDALVLVDGLVLGVGSGRSKKLAEQEAAATAYSALRSAAEGEAALTGPGAILAAAAHSSPPPG